MLPKAATESTDGAVGGVDGPSSSSERIKMIRNQQGRLVEKNQLVKNTSEEEDFRTQTDNAKQMLKDLSLEYNKLRQAAITNELLEITTAMKAME